MVLLTYKTMIKYYHFYGKLFPKNGQGAELRTTAKQHKAIVRKGLAPGHPLQVSGELTTSPECDCSIA